MTRSPRAALFAILVVGGTLAVATVREYQLGASAIAESDDAMAHGDFPRAIEALHAAAEARAPASPYPEQGYARLVRLARDAEARGDDRTAEAAWHALRGASRATRALWAGSPLTDEADEGLARTAWRARTVAQASDGPAFHDAMRETLARDDNPTGWAFLAVGAVATVLLVGARRTLLRVASK